MFACMYVCMYVCLYVRMYELKLESIRACLQAFIEREMMPCIYDAVIIGSLGTVNKNALKVMIDMGMPKTKAKGLVKWCSTSNIISSHQI